MEQCDFFDAWPAAEASAGESAPAGEPVGTGHGVPAVFEPLWEPARFKGAYGGRGSGKSWNFAAMAVLASTRRGVRGACIREVQKTLNHSAKRLLEDMIERLGFGHRFVCQNAEIRTPGGGSITFHGMQDHNAESVKSLEGVDWCWIEEAQTLSTRSLELLVPTIRKDNSEIWASWNPRHPTDPIDQLFRGQQPPADAVSVRANYDENPYRSKALDSAREHDRATRPDRYAHIWLGEYEPQTAGALWSRQVLHERRVAALPVARERTLVAIDPAVSDQTGSDEHGVVVCALGADQRGYLLEDGSLHGTPHQWAVRAVALYDKWDADTLVIEENQGGDLCRYTLDTIRRGLPVSGVKATRGKHVRAEPISALYELGKISHCGSFPELEDQLCQFTASGYAGKASPDRAEALVWAFSQLFPQLAQETRFRPEYDLPAGYSYLPVDYGRDGWMLR